MSLETLADALPATVRGLLNPGEAMALWVLCLLSNDDRFVYETNADLARWMCFREPTAVSRVLSRLERKGFIENHRDGFGRVLYVLPVDDWPLAA